MPPLHVDKDVELVVLHRQVRILEQYPQFVAPASTPLLGPCPLDDPG